jgi:hypothetical protein
LFECYVEEEHEVLQEAELSAEADSENNLGGSSETVYFIGLDVHKKTISYCVRTRRTVCSRKARFRARLTEQGRSVITGVTGR